MIKRVFLVIIFAVSVVASGVSFQPVLASSDICSDTNVDEDLKIAAGCNSSDATVMSVLSILINFAIGLIALGTVATVIYGGFLYIRASGDPGKVAQATKTIAYGLVGLVISLLAYAIVYFVPRAVSS